MTVYVVLEGQDYRWPAVFGVYLDLRTARSEVERRVETFAGRPLVEVSENYWTSGAWTIEITEEAVRT